MKISEAKEIHLIGFLEMNGIAPSIIRGGKAWYYSLFRPNEKTASFIINIKENTWHDFGTGEHGDTIDLVRKLHNISVKEALTLIDRNHCPSYFQKTIEPDKMIDNRGKISIQRIRELSHPALVRYIEKRKVSLQFARLYVEEARFNLYGKRYFALAFKNDKGGYELRNERFKLGNSPKYFTTIKGKDQSTINVFEGFMDFLSWCTYYDKIPESTTIILNSVAFLSKIFPLQSEAKQVNLYLDNDDAGKEAVKKIRDISNRVKDWAPIIYSGFKDFNEYLMKRKPF